MEFRKLDIVSAVILASGLLLAGILTFRYLHTDDPRRSLAANIGGSSANEPNSNHRNDEGDQKSGDAIRPTNVDD